MSNSECGIPQIRRSRFKFLRSIIICGLDRTEFLFVDCENEQPEDLCGGSDKAEVVQKDCLVQFEDDLKFDPSELRFRLGIISYEQLTEELDNVFGQNLIDCVEDEHFQNLADDILKNVSWNPPIGNEGIHRKLAHHYLDRDMLCFEVFRCHN